MTKEALASFRPGIILAGPVSGIVIYTGVLPMTHQYLLAIDQGTTGSTVLVLDISQATAPQLIGKHTVDFKQYYPKTGWVEHDPDEILGSVRQACRAALEQARTARPEFSPAALVGIGITNQRETLCTFDRKTGRPLAKAIVWQDKRSSAVCTRLKEDGCEDAFRAATGLVLDPYFSGTKMTWLLENNSTVATAIREGRAVWGTIDTWLLHALTGGGVFATEASNASRTLAYNIHTGRFDENLLEMLGLPSADCLPEVMDSAGIFGKTRGLDFLPDGIPIAGILGDQQAALAGQACFEEGEAKCTYGTGAFMLLNTGADARVSDAGMLTTVAWSLNGRRTMALEGSSFIAGAAIQFLRDQLGLIDQASRSAELAAPHRSAPELYFVPALAGLGAPYWDPAATGAFFGLTRGTEKGQLIRAALEGMAFSVGDLFESMARDYPGLQKSLRVDGGAAANDLLMQMQADISGIRVDRPVNLETTAFGAAMFAGLGTGLYSDLDDLKNARAMDRCFEPDLSQDGRNRISGMREGWVRAVRAVQVFAGTHA